MRYWFVSLAVLGVATSAYAVTVVRPEAFRAPAWPPVQGVAFDVQLNDPRSASQVPKVPVVELDIDIDPAILNAVKARGTRTICYFSAGSWEKYRSDASSFPSGVKGNAYDGFPDERWLDIRNIGVLGPIMQARMDQCKTKGFDAIDPDNVNGFENSTGFPLTSGDQITYNQWLAAEAHSRGLLIVLKNTTALANTLVADYDMALTESCFKDNFCTQLTPFINASKAVFDLEYADERMNTTQFCRQAKAMHISAILKRSSSKVDSYRKPCAVGWFGTGG